VTRVILKDLVIGIGKWVVSTVQLNGLRSLTIAAFKMVLCFLYKYLCQLDVLSYFVMHLPRSKSLVFVFRVMHGNCNNTHFDFRFRSTEAALQLVSIHESWVQRGKQGSMWSSEIEPHGNDPTDF